MTSVELLNCLLTRLSEPFGTERKTVLQNAQDFYAWTESPYCTMENVKFVFVSSQEAK
ncbi:hypothetical protein DPMN_049116 [Dreissena polymorpha]|uniref:Uncharacterized protein n=1 Tax=Dreissena polymorpha TaxID=45954 RepID=A0A9D4I0T6_DREPO|nr:hypothetical protein DPMN_049116 [Dreissena polymorpha]